MTPQNVHRRSDKDQAEKFDYLVRMKDFSKFGKNLMKGASGQYSLNCVILHLIVKSGLTTDR